MGAKCIPILLIFATAFLFSGCAEAILGCKDGDPLLFFSPVRDFACPEEPADAVSNVQIVPNASEPNNKIVLEWNNPAQTDLRAIEVRWNVVTDTTSEPRTVRTAEQEINTTMVSDGIVRIPNARPNERMRQEVTVRPGHAYRFRIASIDSHDNVSLVQQTQYITAPTNVRAEFITEGTPRVSLTWTAIDGATEYYIDRATADDTNFNRLTTTPTDPSYTDSSVDERIKYTYRIGAVIRNGDGTSTEGANSNAVQVSAPPNTPTELMAAGDDNAVTLEWTAPTGGRAVLQYYIYRVEGTDFRRPTRLLDPVTNNPVEIAHPTITYTDTSAVNGTPYTYAVRAVNAEGGESAYSNTRTVTPSVPDRTAPTFDAPTFANATASGGTVTIQNISEAGIIFWVVYTDGATAPADAAAFRTAATGTPSGNVIAVSGSSTRIGAGTQTISLTTLDDGTNYDFYAVIGDAAGNLSARSPKADITTLDATAPTFGMPTFANATATGGIVTIPDISEAGTIFWVVYTDGATAPANAAALRTAAEGSVGGDVVAVSGSGTAVGAGSHPVSLTTLDDGVSYDFYAVVLDAEDNLSARSPKLDFTTLDTMRPTFGMPTFANATASGGTVTIPNISEAGTLFWVVYTDGATAPADAAALRTAASGSTGGNIVVVSGNSTAIGTGPQTVSLMGLAENTSYDFYAVIRDAAGNLSLLSPVLDFTTADVTSPTFGTLTASPTDNGGTITIPNISEAGTLFWAVYTDGATAPANSAALITAASTTPTNNVVAASGMNGTAVVTRNATVSLTTLNEGTDYDFYAVIRDAAGNSTLSPKLDLRTTSDITAPTFGRLTFTNPNGMGGMVTISSISETSTLFWAVYTDDAPPPATAAALRTVASGTPSGNVVAVSGMDGTAVGTGNATVSLTTLDDGVSYDFYAVLLDSSNNFSALSAKLDLTTSDATPPTFDAPTFTNPLATGGTITISNISEAGTLFWAVYRDATAPSSAAALRTAASGTPSGDVVAVSGSGGTTVSIGDHSLWLTTLTKGTNYDFYAIIRDGAGNLSTLSPKLDITTAAVPPIMLWSAGSHQGNFQFSRCRTELTRANPTLAVARTLKNVGYTQASFFGSTDTYNLTEIHTDPDLGTRQMMIIYEDSGTVRYRPITNGAAQLPLTVSQALAITGASSQLVTWANAGTGDALRTLIGTNKFWSMSGIFGWGLDEALPDGEQSVPIIRYANEHSCTNATSNASSVYGRALTHSGVAEWHGSRPGPDSTTINANQACNKPAHVLCLAGYSSLLDSDNDTLIDIRNLDMLNNIRHNLAGTSYKTSAADSGMQCGTNGTTPCTGYELMRDLDFADANSYADGTINMMWRPTGGNPGSATNSGWAPIGANGAPFGTVFEGNGRSISNLYIRNATNANDSRFGFFGQTNGSSNIRNLLFKDGNVYGGSARDHIGIVVGVDSGGTISNVAVRGGSVHGGDGTDEVGGLAGWSFSNIIASSASTTAVYGDDGNQDNVGGLVGQVAGGSVTASYATGAVSGGGNNEDHVGGLVGNNNGAIRASYATGNVNADDGVSEAAGGLVGLQSGGSIIASYATGNADGGAGANDTVGKLSATSSGTITASYAFGAVSGAQNAGNNGATLPSGVTTAPQLTAPGSASGAVAAEWNQMSSSTLNAWNFGTNAQAPALRYADYDGSGGTDYCAMFTNVPGTSTAITCGTTLLPGQR